MTVMQAGLAVALVAVLGWLALGTYRGSVRLRPCCGAAPWPPHDLTGPHADETDARPDGTADAAPVGPR